MGKRKRIGANGRKDARARQRAARQRAGRTVRRILAVLVVIGAAVGAALGARVGMQKALAWAHSVEWLRVKTVRVRGAVLCDTAEILREAAIDEGTPLTKIKSGEIRARLEAIPWVKNAAVRRQIPGAVTLAVRERTPAAMIARGRVYLVDREGVLAPLMRGAYVESPVVSGLQDSVGDDGARRLTARSRERLNRVLEQLDASKNGLAQRVTQIGFDDDGVVRLSFEANQARAEMREENIRSGMTRLRKVLDASQKRGEWPRVVNLQYRNLAFVQ
jgi:cell division protein FtsQ